MFTIEKILCSHMVQPQGIDWEPYFSWIMDSDKKNVVQCAYRIKVEDNAGRIMWDTGKTESDQTSFLTYQGEKLASRTKYTVDVTVWNNHEEVAQAGTYFETAFMNNSDWHAGWIKSPYPAGERGAHLGEQPQNVIFRKYFTLEEQPEKARLYVSCHGCYQLSVNGRRPDDRELAPEFTAYRAYLNYQTYDITTDVKKGSNHLDILVGDGWYHGFMTKEPSPDYDPAYAVIFQIEIVYADGKSEKILSDDTTQVSLSPVLSSDLFAGERYDARLESEQKWKKAECVQWDLKNLRAQYGQPVRPVALLPVKEILVSPKGEKILDFGQVIAGRIRMKVHEAEGTVITITCTEGLDEKGNFFDNNPTADQRIEYISNGKEAVYEPHFTFQGFRYIMVSGVTHLNADDYMAVVLSSEKENVGTFVCSDPEVTRLYENTRWSQKANMISIPTDCPQREKAGWLGDIQVYTRTALLNEDVTPFLTSWLRNMTCEQMASGALPMVVPLAGAYVGQYEMLKRNAGTADDISPAGWGDAAVLVPWYMYEITGNMRILEEQYETMKRWCDYVIREAHEKRNPDSILPDEIEKYLWNTGFHYGEHLIPSYSEDGYGPATFEAIRQSTKYVAPIYGYYSVNTFSKIAHILQAGAARTERSALYADDAQRYGSIAEKMKNAIQKGVIGPDGEMPADLMGAYAMPLYFDLVPERLKEKFQNRLLSHIRKNHGCLDTGFLGTPILLDVLCRIGRRDLAYELLFQKRAPSWLYEVEHGATTIWESWFAMDENGKPFVSQLGDYTFTMSLNHYAFGCVDDWMFRNINGIDSIGAGYKKIRIQPFPDRRLDYASRTFRSEQGEITSEWRRTDTGEFMLHVKIPCNASAEIVLPDGSKYETGSGTYDFECRLPDKK